MREFLSDIGAVYLLLTGAFLIAFVLGKIRRARAMKPLPVEDDNIKLIVNVFGHVGLVVWFLIGFAVASWLVSLPFAGPYWMIDHLIH